MALLGLLAHGPRSGYDLTREMADSFTYVWHAQHSQIYPELRRLADDGLIVEGDSGPRGRKPYSITEHGLDELRTWLHDTQPDHSQRNETFLRAWFLWLLDPADACRYLREEAEFHRSRLAQLQEMLDIIPTDTRADRAGRLVVNGGIRRLKAMAEWAEEAQAEVEGWEGLVER
jgi:DNA-binding PadR family transcriptional regulator